MENSAEPSPDPTPSDRLDAPTATGAIARISTGRPRLSNIIARLASGVIIALALVALTGWLLDSTLLASVVPGQVAMNPVTAIAFLLSGVALLLHDPRMHHRRIAAALCAAIVVILPMLCFSRMVLPWDLGPDRLLFRHQGVVDVGGFPNRMAPLTAANFVLFGLGLWCLGSRSRRARQFALATSSLGGLIALVALVGYGYGSSSLYAVAGLIPMALNSAVAFLVLALGILNARTDEGLASLIASDRVGGRLLRQLLPAAFIVPLVIGRLLLQGHREGWYDPVVETAIMTIAIALILVFLFLRAASSIDAADRGRVQAEQALLEVNRSLESRVSERTAQLQHANAELKHHADLLRGWFDASPLALCTLAPDDRVLSWNPAAEALFGWQRDEVLGQVIPIVPEHYDAEAADLSARVLAGSPFTNLESRRRHRNGALVDVSISTAALYDGAGKVRGIVAAYADISERKTLEVQLRQSQKMEAVGRLAGGVAHDFNNILMVIQSAAEFLLTDLETGDPRRDDATAISEAAERAARLTRQLLALSRQQVMQVQVLDLNTIVAPMESILRRLCHGGVELVLRLDPALDRVKADASQIEQVILNLVVNARDAIGDTGTIIVETSNAVLDDQYPHKHLSARPGPHAVIAVTDTGAGMDAATQARIFEPFFTTKAPGKGTGLGLATVYGVVKQLGGHVWVYSEPGHGTSFKIYLPQHAPVADTAALSPRTIAPVSAARSETILIVEDDTGLRVTLRGLLEHHHYTVLEAPQGNEALAILADHRDSIDLVISDMIMPEMDGLELHRRMGELGVEIPVLLMSGYSSGAIGHLGHLTAALPIIEKPFTFEAMIARVATMLSLPRRAAA